MTEDKPPETARRQRPATPPDDLPRALVYDPAALAGTGADDLVRMVLDVGPNAVALVDKEGHIILHNTLLSDLFGYDQEEILGKPIEILLPDRFRGLHERQRAAFQSAHQTRRMNQGRIVTCRRKDGTEFPGEIGLIAVPPPGPPFALAIIRDVTAEKAAEERLSLRERQLAEAQQLAHLGSWEWDLRRDSFNCSEELCRILGIEPGTVTGYEGLLARVHADDREALERAELVSLHGPALREAEVRILRPDGTERKVHARVERLADREGKPVRLLGTVQDVTDARRAEQERARLAAEQAARAAAEAAERRMAVLAAVSHGMAESLDQDDVLHRLMEGLVPALAEYASVYLLDEAGESIVLAAVAHADDQKEAIIRELHPGAIPMDSDLPVTRAIRMEEPVVALDDPASVLGPPGRLEQPLAEILSLVSPSSFIAAPLRLGDRMLGALSIATSGRRLDTGDLALTLALARRTVLGLQAARLFREAQEAQQESEEAHRRLAFLYQASGILTESLDLQVVLERLARLAVPDLADHCVIDVIEDGKPVLAVVTHADQAEERRLRASRARFPVDLNDTTRPTTRAVLSGQTVLLQGLPDDAFAHLSHEGRPVLARSLLSVPLIARGQVLGVVNFGSEDPRAFGSEEKDLAEALARRAAMAVDNARLYNQVNETLQQRDALVSNIVHDLSNPLTVVRGYAQSARRRARSLPEGERERFEQATAGIDDAVATINRYLEELRDASRLALGQPLRLDLDTSDLVQLAQKVAETQQRSTDRHKIRVHAESSPLTGHWDTARLERAFYNLISNAVKYSPSGGDVVITLRRDEQGGTPMAVARVSDQGIGIVPDDLPSVFERFFRGRNANSFGGTGIGLASAREVARLHGGDITAESVEGKGSTFTLRIPLVPPG